MREESGSTQRLGDCAANSRDDLQECIRLFDLNRPVEHIPKVEIVEGDATRTIPTYVGENKHQRRCEGDDPPVRVETPASSPSRPLASLSSR